MSPEEISKIDWKKQHGLVPAVIQDATTHRVLMVGYMNREALDRTLESGNVTFWSRSKERLWTKGETSGNVLRFSSARADCDGDALLILASPEGPTCHLERVSCFLDAPGEFLAELDTLIAERERHRPAGSYTTKLFESGVKRVAQKVGEEGIETALAGVVEDDEKLLGEAADLIYHLAVLLRSRGLGHADVTRVLKRRHAKSTGA